MYKFDGPIRGFRDAGYLGKKNIGVTEIFVERITEILINGIRDV